MEVEFDEAIKLWNEFIKTKIFSLKNILPIVTLLFFFFLTYIFLNGLPTFRDVYVIAFTVGFVLLFVMFFSVYTKRKKCGEYINIFGILSPLRKELHGEGIILCFEDIKNVRIQSLHKMLFMTPKKEFIVDSILWNPGVGAIMGRTAKELQQKFGSGKCYSFSTLFHSIPKSYAKFSNLPVEKKLKGGRIKNPGIEKVIRKLNPRWLDPKKDLIRSFDLYSFQSNGKTYYALEIVFDEDLVKSKPKEVYDFYVKVVKEIEKSKAY